MDDSLTQRTHLMYQLMVMSRKWRAYLDGKFSSEGLTDATWRTLWHLAKLGNGVNQKELASALGIEGPSLVRLLDSLSDKGLLERCDDPHDGRAKLLNLTPHGAELVEKIQKRLSTIELEMLSSLSDNTINEVSAFMAKLENYITTKEDR